MILEISYSGPTTNKSRMKTGIYRSGSLTQWSAQNPVKWILPRGIPLAIMIDMSSSNGLARSNEYSHLVLEETPERKTLHPLRSKAQESLTLTIRQASATPAVSLVGTSPKAEASLGWKSARIAIKANGKILLLDPTEIVVVEAQGNYVLLRQKSGSLMVREQISVLADKLRAYGLIRIHRSVLVNAIHVEGVESLCTGEYLLRMKDGMEYHVTRTYKSNLHQLAPTWIGG